MVENMIGFDDRTETKDGDIFSVTIILNVNKDI